MTLFQSKTGREAQNKQSQEQVLKGGLPVSAEQRLENLKHKPDLFTSNFSINEFVLGASTGLRPLCQVMGGTVYQMGWQSAPIHSAELTYVTQAHLKARKLVFGRMQQEAELIGANGVVGVRLEQTLLPAGRNTIEWKAFGTAVAIEGIKPVGKPFLSGLTGQEFWALRQAGYSPVGLVSGVCGYYQKGDCRFRSAAVRRPDPTYPVQSRAYSRRDNREDAGLTAGVYQARAYAMRRLEGEASQAGASGVVGVQWDLKTKLWDAEDFNETFRQDAYLIITAFGTAITNDGAGTLTTDYALPLTD